VRPRGDPRERRGWGASGRRTCASVGQYDLVAIIEGDEEARAAMQLTSGSLGNVRSETPSRHGSGDVQSRFEERRLTEAPFRRRRFGGAIAWCGAAVVVEDALEYRGYGNCRSGRGSRG
jgi:hypothetical protein